MRNWFDKKHKSVRPMPGSLDWSRRCQVCTYIVHNRHLLPNYGERYRNGEPIATGFVESTVNEVVSKRFCKKQQMQWSKEGAHLLVQTRVRTLNGELSAIFKRWYPDMDLEVEGSVLKVEMTA